jgi:hypothetical protein
MSGIRWSASGVACEGVRAWSHSRSEQGRFTSNAPKCARTFPEVVSCSDPLYERVRSKISKSLECFRNSRCCSASTVSTEY